MASENRAMLTEEQLKRGRAFIKKMVEEAERGGIAKERVVVAVSAHMKMPVERGILGQMLFSTGIYHDRTTDKYYGRGFWPEGAQKPKAAEKAPSRQKGNKHDDVDPPGGKVIRGPLTLNVSERDGTKTTVEASRLRYWPLNGNGGRNGRK